MASPLAPLRTRLPALMFRHPARLIVGGFAGTIFLGTLLLFLPFAAHGPGVGLRVSFFTATSAVSVTGLVVVDTGSTFTVFGEAVLIVLMQLGGIGIMTTASLIALFVSRRVGLGARLLTRSETGSLDLGDVRRTLRNVARFSLAIEAVVALLLAARFTADLPFYEALWHGIFHAVAAFNNAGFGLWPDSLTRYVGDPLVTIVVPAAIILGGLGFPVLAELRARLRWRKLSFHTRLTLAMSLVLVVVGSIAFLALEWSDVGTLGPLGWHEKVQASFFQGVTPRTAGFNTVDFGAVRADTLLVTDLFMFIGAGAASTGGGIKVTTFAVLLLACWAEFRGDPHPSIFGRRLPGQVVRQSLTVTVAALGLVGLATFTMLLTDHYPLDQTLFETLSAFGTVGLSTGITADLTVPGQMVLVVLMFLGRVGPATLGAALVLRERGLLYEYPEGRPLVG